jgi:ATP-dependent DNA helicase RecQ
MPLLKILRDTFSLNDFRPGQQAVIERLLNGHSTLAIFPTGAGKSLCYQLPAVALDGLTLVVSPLIALMKDQIDSLHRRGVAAARLDSSLDAQATRDVYANLRSGDLKLLYVAPERLGNERFLETLATLPISLLAVDEAHCISEWGHNFRPDYMKLAALAQQLSVPRVLALTATATPEVAASIAKAFSIAPDDIVRSPFYRPNLHLAMKPGPETDREERLLAALPAGPSIVYVTLQRTAEEVAERIRQSGREALAYHAGLEADRRNAVQDQFMSSRDCVVVATIAFGMGVDKADIRGVIHYNLPKSIENYAQEIGRAGRDGDPSQCTLLASPQDRIALENFTFGDTPTPEALRSLIEEVLRQGEEFDVSVYDLSQRHDIRNLVVETVLTYLELDGVLRSTKPFYAEYRLSWVRAQADVLRKYDPERREFLSKMLACGVFARKWTRLDVHQAALSLKQPRERLIRALNHLEEEGDLQLQVSGVRQGYRRLEGHHDVEAILQRQVERFQLRESRDLARLEQMQQLTHAQDCTNAALLAYFGEKMSEPCGNCATCQGQPPTPLVRESVPLTEEGIAIIERVRAQRNPNLAHPRQLTRFLCGLTSPATTRAKLTRHADYGSLARVPFLEVLQAAERTAVAAH